MKLSLDNPWTRSFTHPVTGLQHSLAATVPGNFEIDLQREGLIGDPYPNDSLCAMRDFERVSDWRYETHFPAPLRPADTRVALVFEGIDTIADVTLNRTSHSAL